MALVSRVIELCVLIDSSAQADRDGKVCYLESSHDVNLIIYGKMGYEYKKPIYLTRGEKRFKMDVMVRYPKSASKET